MLPDLVRFVDLNALRQLSRIKMIKSDRVKPKSAVKNQVNQTVKLDVKPINIFFFCKSTCEKIEFSITSTTSFLAKLQIREKNVSSSFIYLCCCRDCLDRVYSRSTK